MLKITLFVCVSFQCSGISGKTRSLKASLNTYLCFLHRLNSQNKNRKKQKNKHQKNVSLSLFFSFSSLLFLSYRNKNLGSKKIFVICEVQGKKRILATFYLYRDFFFYSILFCVLIEKLCFSAF